MGGFIRFQGKGTQIMAEYIVDTTDGILHARTTGELVRCGECIHFGRCPMRKGDGSGYCWQAKRREAVRHAKDEWDDGEEEW